MRRMAGATRPGAHGKANAGISNDKRGEISGPKAQPNGEADGKTVNIPSLGCAATRRRRSGTAAGLRNTPLKGVGVEGCSQARNPSRT